MSSKKPKHPPKEGTILGGRDPVVLAVIGTVVLLSLLTGGAIIHAPGARELLISILLFVALLIGGGWIHRR